MTSGTTPVSRSPGVIERTNWLNTGLRVLLAMFGAYGVALQATALLSVTLPLSRIEATMEAIMLGFVVQTLLGRVAPGAAQWQITLPGERSPIFGLNWREAGETEGRGRPSMVEEEGDSLSSGGVGAQPPSPRGRSGARDSRSG